MNLQEIRQKYPDYNDMSDADFAQGFHKKFYSDMSFEDFSSKVGYSVKPSASDWYEKNVPQPLKDAVGGNEAVLGMVTGIPAMGESYLKKLYAQATATGTEEEKRTAAAKASENPTLGAIAYEPRTTSGKVGSDLLGKIGETLIEGGGTLGAEFTRGQTFLNDPTLKTTGDVVPKYGSEGIEAGRTFGQLATEGAMLAPVPGQVKSLVSNFKKTKTAPKPNAAFEDVLKEDAQKATSKPEPTPADPIFVNKAGEAILKDDLPNVDLYKKNAMEQQLRAQKEQPLEFESTTIEPKITEYRSKEAGLPFSVEGKLATPVEIGTHAKSVQQGIRDVREIASEVEQLKTDLVDKTEVGPEQRMAIQSLEHDLQNASGRTTANLEEVAQIGRDLAQLKVKTSEGTKTPIQTGPNRGKFGQGGSLNPEIFGEVFPEFLKSTIKDSTGKLKVLYHGGKALVSGMPSMGTGIYGEGTYLTDSPTRSNGYAKNSGGTVYPAYVNIKNPISSTVYAERFGAGVKSKERARQITEQLKQEGYDGVVSDMVGKHWEVVSFYPERDIKSALSGASPREMTLAKDSKHAKALSEKTGTPLGQTGFGKGQRGSIGFFGKTPFEKYSESIKESYPNATPEQIKRAWDKQQSKLETVSVSGVAPKQEAALSKLPWYESKLNKGFLPVEDIQKAKEALQGTTTDIKDSALVGKFASGGVVQSALTDHPVTRIGIQLVNGLKKQSERFANEALNNQQDGILTLRRKVEVTGGVAEFNKTFLDYVKSSLDPEFVPEYSANGKAWVDSLKAKQKEILTRANTVRESFGLRPIKDLNNYFSLMREGPFGFVVKDGSGAMVSFVRERSKGAADRAYAAYKEQMSKEGLDWSVGNVEYNPALRKNPFSKTARGQQLAMTDLAELLGEGNPHAIKANEIYNKVLLQEAKNTSGASAREKFRSGKEGAKGTKEWLSDAENVKEGMESIEAYIRQMNDQIASLEAAKHLKDIITDESIQSPNAKQLIQSYYDHAFNRVDRVTDSMKGLTEWSEKRTGHDSKYALDFIRSSKNALMAMTLGFGNARFLMTQLIQPWQSMPPMLTYLKSIGAGGNATKAQFLGFADGMQYFITKYTNSNRPKFQNSLETAIWDYAEKMHITEAHLLEQPKEFSTVALRKAAPYIDRLATGEMRNFESSTRMMAFSGYTRMLVDSGMPLELALKTADNLTEFSMTSYELHNKPQIYSHLGMIGELASTLQTYKHNALSQQAFFMKEAFVKKNPAAFATQMGLTIMFAGSLGLFGLKELDNLMEWVNKLSGKNNTTPSEYMIKNTPEWFAIGGLSAATGFDFHSSLSGQNIIPETPEQALFSLAGKVTNIAEKGGQFVSNPTVENFADFARQPISTLAGLAEYGLSERVNADSYAYRNPKTRETEAVRSRTEMQVRGALGLKPIRETLDYKRMEAMTKDDAFRKDLQKSTLSQIQANIVEIIEAREKHQTFRENAAVNKNKALYEKYVKLGGDDEAIDAMIEKHQENRGLTTPIQRRLLTNSEGEISNEKALRLKKTQEYLQ